MLLLLFVAALQAPPPARTVGKGPMSDIATPRQVVVRSAAEWSALWTAHGGSGDPPMIDFSREMVVGVFMGGRPTAGYAVQIVRSVAAATTLIVEYVETAPPPGRLTAQVLTAPYHLVAIPTHGGEVLFQKVERP